MKNNINHRICLYCGDLFEANNGNRKHCPCKNGKKDFCKNQEKKLREINKRGGRTEAERLRFLQNHLGFYVSREFMKKNLYFINSENRTEFTENNSIYSRCYFENNFVLLFDKEKKLFKIINEKDLFMETRKGRINKKPKPFPVNKKEI